MIKHLSMILLHQREKVAVVDPDNVTEADLAKIQEKLKLEYV